MQTQASLYMGQLAPICVSALSLSLLYKYLYKALMHRKDFNVHENFMAHLSV